MTSNKIKYSLLAGLSFFLLVMLFNWIYIQKSFFLDQLVFQLIYKNYISPTFYTALQAFTRLCDEEIIFSITTLVVSVSVITQKYTKETTLILLEASLAANLDKFLKFHLTRHYSNFAPHYLLRYAHSFPSGHAMISVCLYGLLFYYLSKYLNPCYKIYCVLAGMTFALLMGYSRLILKAHCITDVLGGYLFGIMLLMFGIYIYNRISAMPVRKDAC